MSWKTGMYAALANMLRDRGVDDVDTVVDFEDDTRYGGYCETCSYEETICNIRYLDTDGKTKTYTFYGSFSELISSL